jgi:hypothetical protein
VEVRYFSHKDFELINDWLVERGHTRADPAEMPSVGFLVSVDDIPTAACFLRRCEGNIGIVEGLVSNPAANAEQRHRALDAAIQFVVEEAKAREMTKLIATSLDSSALLRGCERHGFRKSPQTLIIRNL